MSGLGGICLSDDAYRQVKGKTELHFQDLGEKALKNIPDKVRVHSVNLDPARLSPEAFEALTGERLELPEKPSIAILPFENMSGDPEQEFFADGISEDIITVLSGVSNLVVMARNSTFVYKGQARAKRSMWGRWAGISECVLSWKAACARRAIGSGSPRSWSMRKAATTSGPNATTASSTTSSRCKTRSRARSSSPCRSIWRTARRPVSGPAHRGISRLGSASRVAAQVHQGG